MDKELIKRTKESFDILLTHWLTHHCSKCEDDPGDGSTPRRFPTKSFPAIFELYEALEKDMELAGKLVAFTDGNALRIARPSFVNIQESKCIFLSLTPSELRYIQALESDMEEKKIKDHLIFNQFDGENMHEKVHELLYIIAFERGEQNCPFCCEVIKPSDAERVDEEIKELGLKFKPQAGRE